MPFHTLKLTGLNGSNPLAFLAALGVFRTAQRVAEYEVRLGWTPFKNSWYPVLHGSDDFLSDQQSFLSKIEPALKKGNQAFKIGKNISLPADLFYSYLVEAINNWFNGNDQEFLAFLVSFGSECCVDEKGYTEDTFFRFLRHFSKETDKKGHQTAPGFLDTALALVSVTTKKHLYEALFGTWKYTDIKCSMRWDPDDDRRYALRWKEPSKDTPRTVHGANRLAIEGLPFYPTVPLSKSLKTTGFKGNKATNTSWTWPLWEHPISIDVCCSLLSHSEIQSEEPAMGKLKRIGVCVVLRSRRIIPDKYYKNFSPSKVIGKL